ncbi:MAG: HDOD domain-containing protein [bacterium]|nr:HDOD domain-containing protein [bacterium]
MSIKEDLAFVENIDEFPSMPSVVLTLMSKLNDPETTVTEIEQLINMDPGLVSYILNLTNSLIFGLREEVYDVSRAVVLLGLSNMRSMMTSYSIRLLCKIITNPNAQEYLWGHSLSVGVMAKVISQKVYGSEQPNAYVFGLLHDIGKIALYIHNPRKFQKSLEVGIDKGMDFVYCEKQLFGYSHIEAGYFMTGKLGFSQKMKDIVLFHHDPEFAPPGDKMPWIVSLSNELSHHIYDNKTIDLRRYLEQINLSEDEFNEVVRDAQQQVEQYRSLL